MVPPRPASSTQSPVITSPTSFVRSLQSEPLRKSMQQPLQLPAHQSEARVQLVGSGVAARVVKRILHHVKKAQFPDGQILAQHQAEPAVEGQAQLEHLLAALEMLPDLRAFKLLMAAAHHRAAGRV